MDVNASISKDGLQVGPRMTADQMCRTSGGRKLDLRRHLSRPDGHQCQARFRTGYGAPARDRTYRSDAVSRCGRRSDRVAAVRVGCMQRAGAQFSAALLSEQLLPRCCTKHLLGTELAL